MATPLDELVEYKNQIVNLIENSQDIMSLLVGTQDIDMNSNEVYAAYDKQIFDYSFIMDTQLTEAVFLLIETETRRRATSTCKDMEVFIQVICHKDSMKLTGFKGVKGNRRDNLSRQIAKLLEGSRHFGIGELQLTECYAVNVPSPYSSTMLVFKTPEFARGRNSK